MAACASGLTDDPLSLLSFAHNSGRASRLGSRCDGGVCSRTIVSLPRCCAPRKFARPRSIDAARSRQLLNRLTCCVEVLAVHVLSVGDGSDVLGVEVDDAACSSNGAVNEVEGDGAAAESARMKGED